MPSASKLFYVTFIIMGVFLLVGSFSDTSTSSAQNTVLIPAPNYSTITLDGNPVSLSELKDKVVLINAWATWCEPCREEMPALQELQNKFQDSEFVVVGVSVDEKGSTQMIRDYLHSQNIEYTIWHDHDNKFQYAFRTIGVPESFLIGKDGVILHQWRGGI